MKVCILVPSNGKSGKWNLHNKLENKKNKTLVIDPVWVFEGPQGRVYLLSRSTMEDT